MSKAIRRVDKAALDTFESIIENGHVALNAWGSFSRYNSGYGERLGYPKITPFTRMVTPSRGSEWDDSGIMPLEVEHVDKIINMQSDWIRKAARYYYILNSGSSVRAAAQDLTANYGVFISDARVKEALRVLKYMVGIQRVNDGFV